MGDLGKSRKSGKSSDLETDKSVFFGICLGISARKRGPFLRHFIFSSFVRPGKNQKNDAETATFYRSLEDNSPWDHAQIKERPSWRSIAGSRALYDQMAPQLCLFYISAKFDFCPYGRSVRTVRTGDLLKQLLGCFAGIMSFPRFSMGIPIVCPGFPLGFPCVFRWFS